MQQPIGGHRCTIQITIPVVQVCYHPVRLPSGICCLGVTEDKRAGGRVNPDLTSAVNLPSTIPGMLDPLGLFPWGSTGLQCNC